MVSSIRRRFGNGCEVVASSEEPMLLLGLPADFASIILPNTKDYQKKNLHYTCGITPKCVASDGTHLRGLAPGQPAPTKHHSGGEPFGDSVSDQTGPGIEPKPPTPTAMACTTTPTGKKLLGLNKCCARKPVPNLNILQQGWATSLDGGPYMGRQSPSQTR